MKKILIFGSVVTDLYSRVVRLPEGNEEFCPKETKTRVGGSAFTLLNVCNGFSYPYLSASQIGTGIYGDYCREECKRLGIQYQPTDETAGCTMTLEDDRHETSRMCVAGCEYDFDYMSLQDMDTEDVIFSVVFGDMLCGESADDLIRALEDLSVPVLFIPTDRIDEVDPDVLDSFFSLNPRVFMSDTQGFYLSAEKYHDMKDMAEYFFDMTHEPVYVFQNERGVYGKTEDGAWIAPEDRYMNMENTVSAFIIAMMSGIDEKNAMMFAVKFGTLRRYSLPTAFDYEEQKHRLVELIRGC